MAPEQISSAQSAVNWSPHVQASPISRPLAYPFPQLGDDLRDEGDGRRLARGCTE
jgi:hypothetical protein